MELKKDSESDYLFVIGNETIGECSLSFSNGPYIDWIEIYEEFRHKGYFRQMLEKIFEEFDIDTIEFYCKYSLVKMYEHYGAEIVREIDQRGSSEMILKYDNFHK